MALLNRGRLSVQRVGQEAWDVIQTMGDRGGWCEEQGKKTRIRKKIPGDKEDDAVSPSPVTSKDNPRKRKTRQVERGEDSIPVRRSTRMRTKV